LKNNIFSGPLNTRTVVQAWALSF